MTPAQTELRQRTWRGTAFDERRAERRGTLLNTAFELLGTNGWRETTVRRVCQASRLNPRYFYESFDGLESLLIAVFDDLMGKVATLAIGSLADAAPEGPAAQAHALVGTVMRFVTDDPRRARILFVEALGEERLGRRRLETMHASAQFLERFARWRFDGPSVSDRTTMVAAHIFVGGLSELVIAFIDGKLESSLEQLIDDTASLLVQLIENATDRAMTRAEK